MNLLGVLALGLFLGVRHATDADHVIAVSTIVTRQQSTRAAMRVGALWGLGHTLTIVLVGGAIVLFGLVVPPRLALWMEMAVAVMLVALGAINVAHAALHRTAKPAAEERLDVAGGARSHTESGLSSLRPFAIGTIHGLAGSGALALLVLTTIRDAGAAIVYLVVFGVGTVIGMMALTTLVAMPMAAASRRFASFESKLTLLTGTISVAFGMFLAYQIVVDEGLFQSAMVVVGSR
jgi:sulfite exporter TauE/SafE